MGHVTDPLLEAISKSRRSARDISIRAVGNASAVRNLKHRRDLRVSTLEALCRELNLELYIGPPREDEISRAVSRFTDRVRSPERELLDELRALRKDLVSLRADLAARQRQPGDVAVRGDEYVAVEHFGADVLAAAPGVISVNRQALPSWTDPENLSWIEASTNRFLDSREWIVPAWHLVILDSSKDLPRHGELSVVLFDYPSDLVIGRIRKADDEWVLFTGDPGQEPRTLSEHDSLVGWVAWHGPENSRDLRGVTGGVVDFSDQEWREVKERLASKTREASPAARRRLNSKR